MSAEPPEPGRRGQWLRGVLDLCILALLAPAESYGYELAQALEKAGVGQVQGGSLYPVLLRLERSGYVTAVWRTGDSGPARKYYRLTAAGRRELAGSGAAWLAFTGQIGEILHQGGVR